MINIDHAAPHPKIKEEPDGDWQAISPTWRIGKRSQPSGRLMMRQHAAVASNVFNRSFDAPAPNRKWIADFTYIWTAEGWLYVAAVVGLPMASWKAIHESS